MRWNAGDATRSTGPSQVNLKASWIASTFWTPREITGPRTATDYKVSQMWCSRQQKGHQEKKPKEPNGYFPEAHKEVNYIYGGLISYESRRKQNLTAREVMAVSPATPEYLKWSEVPITFDRSDHPDFVPKPGQYPLIVSPIVRDVKLNQVLIDGGRSLNILFSKTFDQMGLSRSLLRPSRAPFHFIVPGAIVTPVGQISLPVSFGT
jgi:hypothetical protein